MKIELIFPIAIITSFLLGILIDILWKRKHFSGVLEYDKSGEGTKCAFVITDPIDKFFNKEKRYITVYVKDVSKEVKKKIDKINKS